LAEFDNFQAAVAQTLYGVVYVYLAYLAIEPYVRRRWPNMLISWTRALAARFADPRVGRDLLAGCLAGVLQGVVIAAIVTALTTWFHVSEAPSYPWGNDDAIRGWAGAFAGVTFSLIFALIYALAMVVVLLLAQFVARRQWLTISLCIIIGSAGSGSMLGINPIIAIPAGVAISAVFIFVLFRFGILGLSATYFTTLLISSCLLTVDPSRWYFRSSALVLVILAGLAIHGFRTALAGRPMFGRALLED
jgi:hypothetical protein